MSVQRQVLEFLVTPVKNDAEIEEYHEKTLELIKFYLPNMTLLQMFKVGESSLKLFKNNEDILLSIRVFKNGRINIMLEFESEKQTIDLEDAEHMENMIIKNMKGVKQSQVVCPIERAEKYFLTSDQRLLEYDINKVVVEKVTQFQKIQILHSKTFGNMLVLDGNINLSETDLIYTETLMQKNIEKYENKEILILGGGDGALLYELLKENPKFVTLIEIDAEVIKLCNKYMKSISGDVLDTLKGENYEIIIDDCVKYMEKYIAMEKKFDYILGDLTEIPINCYSNCEFWEFMNKILELSFKILKPDGKYLTHGNGANCENSLELYEELLKKINPDIVWKKSKAFIPSFMEKWVFYKIYFP